MAEEQNLHKTTDKPVTSFTGLNLNSGFRLQPARQIVQQPAKAEEVIVEAPVVLNETFTEEAFREVVAAYAKQMQEKGKKQIATMLRPEMVKLRNERETVIEIENSAQKDGFEQYRQEFLDYLRKNLSNNSVTLQLEEKKSESGTKKAYSPIEKFEAMIVKNPLLKELKTRLDMELDY